jgi:hypothetical protein
MKYISLLLSILVIELNAQSQYTYFNSSYFNSDGVYGSALDNIVILQDGLLTHGYVANIDGSNEYYSKLDFQGNVLWSSSQVLPEGTFRYLTPYDSFKKCSTGFVISTTGHSLENPTMHSEITKLSENFDQLWSFGQDLYDSDTIISMRYSSVLECSNGDFLAFGDISCESESGQSSTIILTRLSGSGTLIWHREYPNSIGQLIVSNVFNVNTNEIYELDNGDFLGWYDRDLNEEVIPCAILFNENGEFIDCTHWGGYGLSDGRPFGLPIGNENFIYAYQHANGSFFGSETLTQPRAGIVSMYSDGNINTQFPIFNHEMAGGRIYDLEQCFDSNYLVLGSGAVPGLMNHAFLLQMDENGVEQWYQQYTPPIPYYSLEVIDLEVCPDGGYVFGGYCLGIEPNKQMYWLVKTDACGDVEYDGCWPVTSVLQEPIVERNFSVYPNPAEDLITISLPSMHSESEYLSISVRDIEGNLVHSFDRINRQTEINLDISKWSSGAYHITVVNSCTHAVMSQRFVKL